MELEVGVGKLERVVGTGVETQGWGRVARNQAGAEL